MQGTHKMMTGLVVTGILVILVYPTSKRILRQVNELKGNKIHHESTRHRQTHQYQVRQPSFDCTSELVFRHRPHPVTVAITGHIKGYM